MESEQAGLREVAGNDIHTMLENALTTVDVEGLTSLTFGFNGYHVTVYDFDLADPQPMRERIGKQLGFEILSPEDVAEQARADNEEQERRWALAIEEAGAATEQEMRDADVPAFDSLADLSKFIDGLVDRPHDYGTCVYAMSMAAVAGFNYVARMLGVTGFQASCADMDILRRTRDLKVGRIVNYDNMLYPQYWTTEVAPMYMAYLRNGYGRKWAKGEAQRLLAEAQSKGQPSANVEAWWTRLANLPDLPDDYEEQAQHLDPQLLHI